MKNRTGKLVVLAGIFLAMSSLSFAADSSSGMSEGSLADRWDRSYEGYVGILGGASMAATGGGTTMGAVGVTAGMRFSPYFGAGVFGTYSPQKTDDPTLGLPGGTETKVYNVLGQANFMYEGFHVGGEAGVGITTWTGNISAVHSGESTTDFIGGPEAGYDFKFTRNFSLGVEGHYLFTTADQGRDNFQGLGAVKLWM